MKLSIRDIPARKAETLRNLYSITAQDFCDIFNRQKGLCAICKKQMNEPCVDHDPYMGGREYGQVRGLLCHACNKGIGLFLEDVRLLAAAARYIRKMQSGLQESRALHCYGDRKDA